MKNRVITASLTAYYSRRDIYGNCYWAFEYTDSATGCTVRGTVSGGESNIRQIMFEMNGGNYEPYNTLWYSHELPIRKFNSLTRDWPHAGCNPVELARWIRERMTSKEAVA